MSGQIVRANYIETNIFEDNAAKWAGALDRCHSQSGEGTT
jgi:hypothetical protein